MGDMGEGSNNGELTKAGSEVSSIMRNKCEEVLM